MYVCQWHVDILFGRQGEFASLLAEWRADLFKKSEYRRAKSSRILAGQVGASPSRVVIEFVFDTIADYEAAFSSSFTPDLKTYTARMAPFIISGSQHWKIYNLLEPQPGWPPP